MRTEQLLRPFETRPDEPVAEGEPGRSIRIDDLSAWYGKQQAIRGVTLDVQDRRGMAIIGPSGCGKSTLIRCINRMHEVVPGAWVQGQVLLGDQNVYGPGIDPVAVRRLVGMVFQRPN